MAKRANTKNEAPFAAALDRYFGLAQQGPTSAPNSLPA